MIIDVHCHLLYGVDDGPDSLEESVEMLRHARQQGIQSMILTPHYRHGMFGYPVERIRRHYEQLVPEAEKLGIQLFLGCEFHVNSYIVEYIEQKRCLPLAGSNYLLTEYSFETEYSYIIEQTKMLVSYGYIPVIAHVERYGCILKSPQLCEELSRAGALIQINADSVLGMEGGNGKRFCRKALKNRWADIVASDAHGIRRRACHMRECRDYIAKKYGEDYAQSLFFDVPSQILKHAR